MKKILSIICISFLVNLSIFSQGVNFKWAKSIGGYYTIINSLTIDPHGNLFIVGDFDGACRFDPANQNIYMPTTGGNDAFIAKMDNNGNFLWEKRIGGADGTEIDINSISLDKKGNIVFTGGFYGTTNFDPGVGTYTLTSNGHFDIFIEKLDSNGNFLWVKQMGGTQADFGNSIVIDKDNSIYTVGNFYYTVDFDPGSGIYNLTTPGSQIFIQKLDSNGIFQWAKQVGSGDNFCHTMALDENANIYITGDFGSITDFDPGPATYYVSPTNGSVFVLKLDKNGNFKWVKVIGWNSLAITSDAFGNIYTSGSFGGTVDFDPGPDTFNLTPINEGDFYIEKLDTNGNFKWAKEIYGITGNFDQNNASSLKTDINGNLYNTGYFMGTTDFDPGPNIFNLCSFGGPDVFIQKLDSSGNFIWAKQIGNILDDRGLSVITDLNENVYLTGFYSGIVDFDPGSNTYNLPGNDSSTIYTSNSFILKLGPCSPVSTATIIDTSCNSLTLNNHTYTLSGIYSQTLTNSAGCDSLLTINLFIKANDTTVIQTGNILTAQNINANYQWVDCANGYSQVLGQINQTFSPISDGSYALVVSHDGCIDTSSCHIINTSGIKETSFGNNFLIYPVPASESVTFEFPQKATLEIFNMQGRLIKTIATEGTKTCIDISSFPCGMYFVKAITNQGIVVRKFIKE